MVSGQDRQQLQFPVINTASRQSPETEPFTARIAALPDANPQMKVFQRRSKLLVARSNLVHTAVAESNIIDNENWIIKAESEGNLTHISGGMAIYAVPLFANSPCYEFEDAF